MKWKKKKTCTTCDKEHSCSDCQKYQDKAFELEVDEELQQEKLAAWWKKYSWCVYGGVVAILGITAGTQWYHIHQMNVRLKESDAFEKATVLMYEDKKADAISAFQNLAKSGKTGYRTLALMNLADLKMSENKKEESLAILHQILTQTSFKDPLHLVTTLTYVGYQLEEGNPDELLKVLAPTLKNQAFQGLATELAVPLLNKQGKKAEALNLIQQAIQNPTISAGTKARLNALKGE